MTPSLVAALTVVLLAVAAGVLRLTNRGLKRVSIDLSRIEVYTAAGAPVRIGALVNRPTILVLPRYYG